MNDNVGTFVSKLDAGAEFTCDVFINVAKFAVNVYEKIATVSTLASPIFFACVKWVE